MKMLLKVLLLSMLVLIGCSDPKGTTVRNLGDLIAAVSLYYGDHNGQWPPSLDSLIPKYVDAIPEEEMTKTNRVVTAFDGKGGWVYNSSTGEVKINIDFKRSP